MQARHLLLDHLHDRRSLAGCLAAQCEVAVAAELACHNGPDGLRTHATKSVSWPIFLCLPESDGQCGDAARQCATCPLHKQQGITLLSWGQLTLYECPDVMT